MTFTHCAEREKAIQVLEATWVQPTDLLCLLSELVFDTNGTYRTPTPKAVTSRNLATTANCIVFVADGDDSPPFNDTAQRRSVGGVSEWQLSRQNPCEK